MGIQKGSSRGSRLRGPCFVPNPSGTIDLPENKLDAVTTELWKTIGWQGHILAYLPTLPVFPGVSKFFMKSPGLPVRAPNLPGTTYLTLFTFLILINFVGNVLLLHRKKWNPPPKKKIKCPLIKMAPTLKFLGLSPGFCTLGVGRYVLGSYMCI